ncbi:hypothetical protein ATANTOWER_016068 [Ataeniobius toweri]|uniref:Uncharacterized protein n=1 Tax=Ataeniobius toweri TaxID=208326 RepID=A0ABU7A7I7_9TELE|nr:hypothetical protein [Ataeniobius toweri]
MIHNKEAESEAWFYGFTGAVSAGLAHLISVAFSVFIAFLSRPGTSWFSWHPFLMTVAAKHKLSSDTRDTWMDEPEKTACVMAAGMHMAYLT